MISKKKIQEEGVLKSPKHDRLIAEIDAIADRAGLHGHPYHIWKSVEGLNLTDTEKDYIASIREVCEKGIGGLLYIKSSELMTKRFMAITGLLVRNFVDARFLTRADIITAYTKGYEITGSVILIPDFFISDEDKKAVQFQKDALTHFLVNAMKNGQQLVLQVSDTARLKKIYGEFIYSHLSENFVVVS